MVLIDWSYYLWFKNIRGCSLGTMYTMGSFIGDVYDIEYDADIEESLLFPNS